MSLLRYAKQYINNQTKYQHLNAFISQVDQSVLFDRPQEPKDGNPLYRKAFAIKDNICTKELHTTAASGMLETFKSPYDATVVKLLQEAGAVVVGKTHMDEFGMGSHTTHSHAGPAKLQRYEGEERSAGGSSGGSALAVASAQCWAALGTDTGGSVRLPAAYTGVVGFKPSYGLLSRWGVIAYANSLDTVGIFAKNARDVQDIFNKLNVYDPQDPTSLPPSTRSRLGTDEERPQSLRIGIPLDYNIATLDPTVRNTWMRALRALSEKGHTLHPVRLPATQHAISAYYVLAPAEASSNLAKYDGVRFGSRADGVDGTPDSVLFSKTRGDGFGPEVQRRILLGAFSLSAEAIDNYFLQAQKVRRLVQQDLNNVFAKPHPLVRDATAAGEGVDVLLCPTAPTLAPTLSEVQSQDPIQTYMNDVFTVPASLAGLPAISVPVPITDSECSSRYGAHEIKESAGIQIIGQYGDDKRVLYAAWELSSVCKTPQRTSAPHMTAWGHSSLGKSTVKERQLYAELAMELGITVAEAKPIGEGRLQKQKEKVGNMLDVALGAQHLESMAKMLNVSKAQYIARYANEEDPVAAEKAFYERFMAFRQRTVENREKKAEERKRIADEKRLIAEQRTERSAEEEEAQLARLPAWKAKVKENRLQNIEPSHIPQRVLDENFGDSDRVRFVGHNLADADKPRASDVADRRKNAGVVWRHVTFRKDKKASERSMKVRLKLLEKKTNAL